MTSYKCIDCSYALTSDDFDAGKGRIMFSSGKGIEDGEYRCGVCDPRGDDECDTGNTNPPHFTAFKEYLEIFQEDYMVDMAPRRLYGRGRVEYMLWACLNDTPYTTGETLLANWGSKDDVDHARKGGVIVNQN